MNWAKGECFNPSQATPPPPPPVYASVSVFFCFIVGRAHSFIPHNERKFLHTNASVCVCVCVCFELGGGGGVTRTQVCYPPPCPPTSKSYCVTFPPLNGIRPAKHNPKWHILSAMVLRMIPPPPSRFEFQTWKFSAFPRISAFFPILEFFPRFFFSIIFFFFIIIIFNFFLNLYHRHYGTLNTEQYVLTS